MSLETHDNCDSVDKKDLKLTSEDHKPKELNNKTLTDCLKEIETYENRTDEKRNADKYLDNALKDKIDQKKNNSKEFLNKEIDKNILNIFTSSAKNVQSAIEGNGKESQESRQERGNISIERHGMNFEISSYGVTTHIEFVEYNMPGFYYPCILGHKRHPINFPQIDLCREDEPTSNAIRDLKKETEKIIKYANTINMIIKKSKNTYLEQDKEGNIIKPGILNNTKLLSNHTITELNDKTDWGVYPFVGSDRMLEYINERIYGLKNKDNQGNSLYQTKGLNPETIRITPKDILSHGIIQTQIELENADGQNQKKRQERGEMTIEKNGDNQFTVSSYKFKTKVKVLPRDSNGNYRVSIIGPGYNLNKTIQDTPSLGTITTGLMSGINHIHRILSYNIEQDVQLNQKNQIVEKGLIKDRVLLGSGIFNVHEQMLEIAQYINNRKNKEKIKK